MPDQRRVDVILIALLVLAPLLYVPLLDNSYLLPKESLLLFLGTLAFALATPRVPKPLLIAWLLIAAGGAIATINALDEYRAWRGTALHCVWFGLVLVFASRKTIERRALRAIWLVGVLIAVIALVRLPFAPAPFTKLAFVGTLGNPDYVGACCAIALLLAIFQQDKGRWELLRRASIPLLGIGLLISRSRGSWLAFLVALTVFGLRTRWRKPLLIVGGASLALFLLLAATNILPETITSAHTLRGRFLIWAVSLELIGDAHGLGIGFDNFDLHYLDAQRTLFATGGWDAFSTNAAVVRRSHNEFLDYLTEGGLLALAGWLTLLVWAARSFQNKQTPYASVLLFAVVHAMVSFPFHIVPSAVLIAFALGQVIPLELSRANKWARGLLILPVAVLFFEGRAWLASYEHRQSLAAIEAEQYQTAEAHNESALRWHPADHRLHLTKARLLYRRFKTAEALAVLEALGPRQRTIEVLKLKGLILIERKDLASAEQLYRDLATAFPNHVTPQFRLGQIYLSLNKTESAEEAFRKALAVEPKSKKARGEQDRIRTYLQK